MGENNLPCPPPRYTPTLPHPLPHRPAVDNKLSVPIQPAPIQAHLQYWSKPQSHYQNKTIKHMILATLASEQKAAGENSIFLCLSVADEKPIGSCPPGRASHTE